MAPAVKMSAVNNTRTVEVKTIEGLLRCCGKDMVEPAITLRYNTTGLLCSGGRSALRAFQLRYNHHSCRKHHKRLPERRRKWCGLRPYRRRRTASATP